MMRVQNQATNPFSSVASNVSLRRAEQVRHLLFLSTPDQATFTHRIHFGADSAFEDAQAMGDLAGKKEGFVHQAMRGNSRLGDLSKAFTYLPIDAPEKQEWLRAYTQVIHYALRDKSHPQPDALDILDPQKRSLQVDAVLSRLGISWEEFEIKTKEAVIDAEALHRGEIRTGKLGDVPIIPASWFDRIKLVGAPKFKIPEQLNGEHIGGMGLHPLEYAQSIASLVPISGAISAAMSANATLGVGTSENIAGDLQVEPDPHGNPYLKTQVYKSLANQESLIAFATTEVNAGTDLGSIATQATLTRDPDTKELYWDVVGEKQYTTNFPRAGWMVITAQTNLNGTPLQELERAGLKVHKRNNVLKDPSKVGQTALLVKMPFTLNDDPATIQHKLTHTLANMSGQGQGITAQLMDLSTLRGSGQAHQKIHHLRIPVKQVIGEIGNGKDVALRGLSDGRAGIAAMSLGNIKLLQRILDERANDPKRKQFGSWQADMEQTKKVIGDVAIKVAGMQAAVELMFSLMEHHGKEESLIPEANLMKAWSSEVAHQVVSDVRHQFGGTAFNTRFYHNLSRLYEDTDILRTVEGVNEAMLQAGSGLGFSQVGNDLLKLEPYSHLKTYADPKAWKKLPGALVSGAKVLYAAYFKQGDYGVLSPENGKWIQKHDRALALTMMKLAGTQGKALVHKQTLTMAAGNIAAELFALKAAMIKLAKYEDELPKEEAENLKAFIKLTKSSVKRTLKDLKRGLPETQTKIKAGERHIQNYRQALGVSSPLDEKKKARAAKK